VHEAARVGAATKIRLERPKVRIVRALHEADEVDDSASTRPSGQLQRTTPARLAQSLGHDRIGLLHVHHDDAAALVEGLSDFGDSEATRGTLDEPDAEARLQSRYSAAQSRFRRPQRPPRRSEAAMGHHLGEEGIVVEIRRHHRLIWGTLKLNTSVYRVLRSMNILFLTGRAMCRPDQGDRR
jgi:hypothetical protein